MEINQVSSFIREQYVLKLKKHQISYEQFFKIVESEKGLNDIMYSANVCRKKDKHKNVNFIEKFLMAAKKFL